MLVKNPSARLSNINLIQNHSYFKDFSFEELLNLSLHPPYFPKIQDPQNLKMIPLKKHLDSYLREYSTDNHAKINIADQAEYDKWFFEF